jgi:hypothetical protein
MSKKSTGLKRHRYPMPEFVRTALEDRNLMGAYLQRPHISKMITSGG